MLSWEQSGVDTLVPPVATPDRRGHPADTVQKGEKKKVGLRGWLAFGAFFLTTAIGYGLMFMVIDNWLKG
jgi:hypothetical protein